MRLYRPYDESTIFLLMMPFPRPPGGDGIVLYAVATSLIIRQDISGYPEQTRSSRISPFTVPVRRWRSVARKTTSLGCYSLGPPRVNRLLNAYLFKRV
jgi:hypothetical protein